VTYDLARSLIVTAKGSLDGAELCVNHAQGIIEGYFMNNFLPRARPAHPVDATKLSLPETEQRKNAHDRPISLQINPIRKHQASISSQT